MFGLGDIAAALPKLLEMQPMAEQFVAEWLKFMNKLGDKLTYIEAKQETADNKLSYLCSELDTANERLLMIMSETNITPSIQSEVFMMAGADPRNARPNDPDNVGSLRISVRENGVSFEPPMGVSIDGHQPPS